MLIADSAQHKALFGSARNSKPTTPSTTFYLVVSWTVMFPEWGREGKEGDQGGGSLHC